MHAGVLHNEEIHDVDLRDFETEHRTSSFNQADQVDEEAEHQVVPIQPHLVAYVAYVRRNVAPRRGSRVGLHAVVHAPKPRGQDGHPKE